MTRPATGRRARVLLAAVCLAAVVAVVLDAQTVDRPRKYSRLERLDQWTTALERHEPGSADAALNTFADWSAREFAELKITFYSALDLIRDPNTRTFFRPPAPGVRSSQVFYSRDELWQLQAVAARLTPLGHNHVLRRGAMLHTDAVVLGAGTDSRGGARRSDFFIYRFDDGQALDQLDALGQWDVARFLLEQIRPDPRDFRPKPSGDDWVRRWYRTLIAFMLSQMHFMVADAERGLELFPADPEMLFFGGVFHEALASPAIQEPLRKSDDVRRSVRAGTAWEEFNAAERLLRRAVKLNPDFAEARLHLGRVLAEQEHHEDALPELTRALSVIKNEDLQYYGQLFTGRSAAALGQIPAARAAFERAAALRPAAQSPLLALSRLAYSRGESAEAAALLGRVAALPALDGDDPWWTYNTTVGRFFAPSHQQIAEDLRKEKRR